MLNIDLLIKVLSGVVKSLEEYKLENPDAPPHECPECPQCPEIPECPECPECEECQDCPECPECDCDEEPTDPPDEPTDPTDPPDEPEEPTDPVPPVTGKSIVGTNIHALVDWSPEYAFVNIFKQARPWVSGRSGGAWQDDRPVTVDADGWPTSLSEAQVLHTFVFWSNNKPSFKSGNYVVTWEGDADLSFYNQPVASRTANRAVLNVNANNGGIAIDVTRINPSNYLKNIKIVHEDDVNSTEVFSPAFLDSLKDYSFVRFMDYQRTNDGNGDAPRPAPDWNTRPKATNAFYTTEKGVPLEIMVQLANKLGVDAWFCMNAAADDSYVRKFAETVKNTLNNNLKVYVENSNECWNGGMFRAHQTFLARARTDRPRFYGSDGNDFLAAMRVHSARSVEIFKIWTDVFGGTERIVRTMGGWAANAWTNEQLLSFENAHQFTDAIAIAPYFGGGLGNDGDHTRARGLTLDQVFAEINSKWIPEAVGWMRACKTEAARFNVKMVGYEGGQHLAAYGAGQSDATLNSLFDRANLDPRMGQAYKTYLDAWVREGGEEFANFSHCSEYSIYGRWGSITNLISPKENFPKYTALKSWIAANKK